jgi:hypothetical protein
VLAAFVDTVQGFKVGDPTAEDTYIGAITPGCREAHVDSVLIVF